jgi:tRNA (guanine-N7-)-methyltransferase
MTMGRRALPKIDPELDYSRHFLTLEELQVLWKPAQLFGREAPLEVEVGSGKGLFLQNAAQNYPEHNFLGIEVAHKYARFTAARLAKRGLTNAIAMQGDGLKLFREIIPDNSLAAVHVYFPDPWWKKRHHKRRVLSAEFVADVYRTLVSNGRFHFWTDVKEYFDASLELMAQTSFQGPLDVPEKDPEHALDFRTHFERRTRLHEQPVYRAEFVK